MTRCAWVPEGDPLYLAYHDSEWGVPVHSDRLLFEYLCLEGAQAGLSWRTILHRREHYRRAFANFEPELVAGFTDRDVLRLLADPGIVRNRLKIRSAIGNARQVLAVQERTGSLSDYLWRFVDGRPRVNRWRAPEDVPATSAEANVMSRTLRQNGFSFVGPTICYSFMQATGMVMDHVVGCFRHDELAAYGKKAR